MDNMKRLLKIVILVTILILVDVSTAAGEKLPDAVTIIGVVGHAQDYSLSCEARSAADVAAFWGIYASETEILWALPQADNPEHGFVGNPNEAWGNIPPYGYGVYAGPIADVLDEFGLQAEGLDHLSWDDLRSQVSGGNPVIVWIIGQMWPGTAMQYAAPDGSTTIVAAFEHTMILTGYSPDTVQVIDAYSGQYQTYPLSTFLESWSVLGNMAVFVSPAVNPQPDSPDVDVSDTYIVQPGDYLIALAKKFAVPWQQLAEQNGVSYPFTIHPGQALQIPYSVARASHPAPAPQTEEDQPALEVVMYHTQLPIIQHDFGAQPGPEITSDIASQVSELDLDENLWAQLASLLGPHVINPAQFVK
jgi:uncharacterized protein YvpB